MAVDDQGNQIIEPASPNPAQERITQLSEKVRLTSEERDTKNRLLMEEQAKAETLTKERDFYQGFSDVVSLNPAAKDHKEDILAKVKSGYTVEDATYAVLGKAGKLGQPAQPAVVQSPAGGSAPNAIVSGQKAPGDMTQAERRTELEKSIAMS